MASPMRRCVTAHVWWIIPVAAVKWVLYLLLGFVAFAIVAHPVTTTPQYNNSGRRGK